MPRMIRQSHRDYYEIINHIFQNVYTKAVGCRPSELAYRCEFPWQQFRNYRDLLISHNLLMISSNSGPNQHYEITPKGERFLQLFAEIEEVLKSANTA